MTYHSVIRDFKNINMAQAENLRARLSLSMSADTLAFCGNYYQTKLKRDPFWDELKMLDMLTAAKKQIGASLALTEFFTNDAFAASTYADLLKKHKELHPESSHPLTLAEVADVANEYLASKQKKKSRSNLHLYLEDTSDGIFYPDASCVATANSPYRLRLLKLSNSAAKTGDILVLISPTEKDTPNAFHRKFVTLLQNNAFLQSIKNITAVGIGGILTELLDMAEGVHIHLPSLSPDDKPIPSTVLCNQFLGCQILRIAPKQWNKISALLESNGLRAISFATVIRKPKFVFARNKQSKFEIDTHFLRSLKSYETVCAKPKKAPARDFLSMLLDLFCNKVLTPLTPLTPKNTTQLGEVTQIDSYVCAASTATPAGSHYKTALWSILAPTLALCACGVPYSKQALTVALGIPKDLSKDTIVSKYLSTVLGLYRAQTELELTSTVRTFLQNDKSILTPSIYVWASAKNAKKMPCIFTEPGSFVYFVSPTLDADGLPEFADFQKTLNSIAKCASKGKILSYRVLSGETIADGIRQMSSVYTCDLIDETVLNEDKHPLFILIESQKRLPWRCIAKVLPFDA